EGIASCYLIADHGELAIVETNTNHAVPFLLQAIKDLGCEPGQVKYVILSHIHLDHAGGAGLLMTRLPNAQLVVHARGRKHMIDPGKLIEGVKAVYGEDRYRELYGDILPIPKERVRAISWTTETGGTPEPVENKLELGGRTLELFDAPGHAKHHMFIFDPKTRSVLSGDAFGISYPRFTYGHFRLTFPSTSPVQFEPGEALDTYQKIVDLEPYRILLTHYGSIIDVPGTHSQLKEWIDFSVTAAEKRYGEGLREKELYTTLYKDIEERFDRIFRAARGSGLTDEEKEFLFLDADLNAQGLAHYIAKAKTSSS
ncbi:MAG TPA: MBL fold metallo-hydrolase, partial [Candidatus Kapabacteria bacterium]|nr:MBL fold metallo-hydrolase [Candidatus Kapabacteria bacterium]